MADDGAENGENDEETEEAETDENEPVVELGEGKAVEGVPLARVASRLTWGIGKSEIDRRMGGVEIRTPDGPRSVSDVLGEVETPYFERRQAFETSVREVVGAGVIPTTNEE